MEYTVRACLPNDIKVCKHNEGFYFIAIRLLCVRIISICSSLHTVCAFNTVLCVFFFSFDFFLLLFHFSPESIFIVFFCAVLINFFFVAVFTINVFVCVFVHVAFRFVVLCRAMRVCVCIWAHLSTTIPPIDTPSYTYIYINIKI